MSKVLVTGSNGFLGRFIINELARKNIVLSLSRNSGEYSVYLEKDIPLFKDKFEIVVHSAGKAHSVPRTESEIRQFYDVNVLGTLNLLKGLEKSGLPKEFVFISSVAVYGLEVGNNISEEHPLLAKDPYGLSKINAEKIVQEWCNVNQVKCSILRLPLLVGKNAPGNLGAMVKAINKGYYFNIGGGLAKKSMVLAKDIASFIELVSPIGGVYNLTDGVNPSFNELSLMISKNKKFFFSLPLGIAKLIGIIGDIMGEKAPINSSKVRKITSNLTFDDSKARQLLNWKPEPILDFLNRENI